MVKCSIREGPLVGPGLINFQIQTLIFEAKKLARTNHTNNLAYVHDFLKMF